MPDAAGNIKGIVLSGKAGEALERIKQQKPVGCSYPQCACDGHPDDCPVAHLREDAPFKQCTVCQRKTWDKANEVGSFCHMTQPDGSECPGYFVDPLTPAE